MPALVKVVVGAVLAGFGLLALSGTASAADDKGDDSKPKPDDGPVFKRDDGAEQAACKKVADEKPLTHDGRSRMPATALPEWLGWVAYRIAYPSGPQDPGPGTEWTSALIRQRACVAARLNVDLGPSKQNPEPPPPPPQLPTVENTLKPGGGYFYRIQQGNTFFAITKAVYGKAGGANLKVAQKVNANTYNVRLQHPAPQGELNFWKERISFLPEFGSFAEQYADAKDGSEGKGDEYAVIWLPPAAEVT